LEPGRWYSFPLIDEEPQLIASKYAMLRWVSETILLVASYLLNAVDVGGDVEYVGHLLLRGRYKQDYYPRIPVMTTAGACLAFVSLDSIPHAQLISASD
jgi:hypothetical protein